MVATYRKAIVGLKENDLTAMTLILDHHVAYAQALTGYLAVDVVNPSSAPLAAPTGSLAGIARQLAALEDQTATIHTDTIGAIKGLDAAMLLASIVTVEARHAAALELIAGASPIAAVGN
jgi:polynucleotide 5'-kinase involved in rRNA processing